MDWTLFDPLAGKLGCVVMIGYFSLQFKYCHPRLPFYLTIRQKNSTTGHRFTQIGRSEAHFSSQLNRLMDSAQIKVEKRVRERYSHFANPEIFYAILVPVKSCCSTLEFCPEFSKTKTSADICKNQPYLLAYETRAGFMGDHLRWNIFR